jgi:hypothetical protein
MVRVRRLVVAAAWVAISAGASCRGSSSENGTDSGTSDSGAGAVCGTPPDAGGANSDAFCATYAAIASDCGIADPCTMATVQCCSLYSPANFSAAFMAAFMQCHPKPFNCDAGLGIDDTCLLQALSTATPTAVQQQLKTSFCKVCPDGSSMADSRSCAGFYDTGADGGQYGVGAQVLLASDSLTTLVASKCLSGGSGDCAAAFLMCAGNVLGTAEASPPACAGGDM